MSLLNLSKKLILVWVYIILVSCNRDNKNNSSEKIQQKSIEVQTINESEYDSTGSTSTMFDIPDLKILKSPDNEVNYSLEKNEKIIQTAVSPIGNTIALLTKNGSFYEIKIWDVSNNEIVDNIKFPLEVVNISWHSRATSIYAITKNQIKYTIEKYTKKDQKWIHSDIFSSTYELNNLVFCSRPFVFDYQKNKESKSEGLYNYRFFFGMKKKDNSFRIMSLTENGKRMYQVVGPKETFSEYPDAIPSEVESDWAVPVSFHPAGHQLIYKDKNRNHFYSEYGVVWGKESNKIGENKLLNVDIIPFPNGLGVLNWKENQKGIGLYSFLTDSLETQLINYQFNIMPSIMPDGRGIIGVTEANGISQLNYLPINIALHDVFNAWMFINTKKEKDLFIKNSGAFVKTDYNQLFSLYESENYGCGGYSASSPTRPYLVTTDIFWELLGSAYQGIYVTLEKNEAIPNFWKFVSEANQFYQKSNKNANWAKVFKALSDLHSENKMNAETEKMYLMNDQISDVKKEQFQFSNLKPRGHYTISKEFEQYFMAFKYLTTIYNDTNKTIQELNLLPENVKSSAMKWLNSYKSLISNPRNQLVWQNQKTSQLPYQIYPSNKLNIFPLAWGVDNEVLFNTIYHSDFPEEFQIKNDVRFRELPSGIDFAASIKNNLALELIKSDYAQFPVMEKVIQNLQKKLEDFHLSNASKTNIYDCWLKTLATQWADIQEESQKIIPNNKLWQAKRLQTGLATWATLRHTTILANEMFGAECGEGGFEHIILRSPKGFVEPDPKTFSAIASLFDELVKVVEKMDLKTLDDNNGSLKDGIIKRLKECSERTNYFRNIALKEISNVEITGEEYENIFNVGRTAEHNFLVFNSLLNKDNALSLPDPIAKIADVAGKNPYLMVAVGYPLEWQQIVPHNGFKEIVKGSVYSYHEFHSNVLSNDKEWREQAKSYKHLPWVSPFLKE